MVWGNGNVWSACPSTFPRLELQDWSANLRTCDKCKENYNRKKNDIIGDATQVAWFKESVPTTISDTSYRIPDT